MPISIHHYYLFAITTFSFSSSFALSNSELANSTLTTNITTISSFLRSSHVSKDTPRGDYDYDDGESLRLLYKFFDLITLNRDGDDIEAGEGKGGTGQTSVLNILTPACKTDLKLFLKGLFLLSAPWAWTMVDSGGKLPSGLASGNFFAPGAYDQCLNVSRHWLNYTAREASRPPIFWTRPLTGPSYCALMIDVSDLVWGPVAAAQFRSWSISRSVVPLFHRAPGQFHFQGLCLPSACTSVDLALLADRALDRLDRILSFRHRFDPFRNATKWPSVVRVVCTDANGSTTWWDGLVGPATEVLPNATVPIVPIIYEAPARQIVRAARRKRIDLAVGTVMFGLAAFALLAAIFYDRLFHECRRRLVVSLNLHQNEEGDDSPILADEGGAESAAAQHPVAYHLGQVATCFSPLRNVPLALVRDDTPADNFPIHVPQDSDGYTDLELLVPGLRAISILWIMCAQTYALAPPYTSNSADMAAELDNVPFLSLNGAAFAIDTFLFLSGLGVASALARPQLRLDRGLGPWLASYAYRLFRFTPAYAAVICFVVTFGPYVGSGPIWLALSQPALGDGLDGNCRTNWWTNLMYINNFVRSPAACLPWTWYLANEAQFFILAPLLVYIFKRSPTLGTVVMAHFMVATLAASFALSYVNDYKSTFSLYDPRLGPFFYDYYIRPYVRMAPYLIGLGFGCYFYFFEGTTASQRGDEDEGIGVDDILPGRNAWRRTRSTLSRGSRVLTDSPLKRAAGLAICLALGAALIYAVRRDVITNAVTSYGFTRSAAAAYNTLSHPVWAVALACLVSLLSRPRRYAGGLVRTLLTSRAWVGLGNLTFAAYLVHPIVLITFYQSLGNSVLYFTHPHFALMFVALTALTFAIAFVVRVAFEMPIINLARRYGPCMLYAYYEE